MELSLELNLELSFEPLLLLLGRKLIGPRLCRVWKLLQGWIGRRVRGSTRRDRPQKEKRTTGFEHNLCILAAVKGRVGRNRGATVSQSFAPAFCASEVDVV